MSDESGDDVKTTMHRYLRTERDQLLTKIDGLGEYDMRRPLTPTGTNLLGILKHVASVQLGYFGETFGRPSGIGLPWLAPEAELNADMWATADESRDDIVELYRRSASHSDATIEALDLRAEGSVPWWPEERRAVTLDHILVRLVAEIARHAGQADIVRELIDERAGNDDGNLPEQSAEEWAAYRARLEAAAVEAERRYGGS
jgi:uncharacterized damage-inducible protein DinB